MIDRHQRSAQVDRFQDGRNVHVSLALLREIPDRMLSKRRTRRL
jgi:hypothetical protein